MKKDCKRCQRNGLPILPVIYAVAPKETLAGYAAPKGKNGLYGANVYNRTLKETAYYLRRPGAGYIYLLYPNAVWKGYLIDSAGYPRYYPDLLIEDMPSEIPEKSEVVACERIGGGDHTGIESITIEPPEQGMVWIAFSRTKWTKKVLEEYAKKPAVRMQFITPLNGKVFHHAEQATPEALKEYLVDFNSSLVKNINKTLPANGQIRDMSGREKSLITFMQASSGNLKTPGVIMALYDPIGMAATLNDFRNCLVQEGQCIDKATTEKEKEDFSVISMIETIRDGVQKNGGDWARYEKHLAREKYDPVNEKFLKRKNLVERAAKVSKDFVQWMNADHTKYVFCNDFEVDCKASGLDLEDCFVKCVQGSGVTKEEREEVWTPWFEMAPSAPENILWKAASANDKDIIATLAEENTDKLFDVAKGSIGTYKETPWFEHMHNAWAKVQQRRQQLPEFRQATHDLAATLGAQLLWLKDKSNTQYFRTAARMASVLVTRGDLLMLPKNMTAGAHNFVRWAQEAFLAVPNIKVPLVSKSSSKPKDPRAVNPGKIANEEARVYAGMLDGAIMVDLSKREAPVAFTAWVISKLEPGKDMKTDLAREFRKLGLDPQKFALPEKFNFNPLSKEARGLKNARFLDRPLSSISGIFAFFSFMKAADEFTSQYFQGDKADTGKKTKAIVGMLTAAGSGIAAGVEITAANMVIARRGIETLSIRVVGLSAGAISCVVGLTDAYLMWKNASELATKGDTDASDSALISAGLGAFSSVVGFAGGIMIFVGATVGLVFVLGFAVAFAIASVVIGIQSDDATDTELELWINRGRFGTHSRPDCQEGYVGLKEETQGFLCAVYAVRIVKIFQAKFFRAYSGKMCQPLKVELIVPFYTENSRMIMSVIGKPSFGEAQVLYRVVYGDGFVKGQETINSLKLESRRVISQREGSGLILKGSFSIEQYLTRVSIGKHEVIQDNFKEVVVAVDYQPDLKTWPDFMAKVNA